MKTVNLWVSALVLCSLCTMAMAQDTLSYQGNILNAARQPVSASYPMVFKLYAEREGGDALWTENYDSVDILDGTFNVELGAVTLIGSGAGRMGRSALMSIEGEELLSLSLSSRALLPTKKVCCSTAEAPLPPPWSHPLCAPQTARSTTANASDPSE